MPVLKAVHFVVLSVLAGGAGLPLLQGEGLNGVTLVSAAGALAIFLRRNTAKQPALRALIATYTAVVGAVVAAFTDQNISAVEFQQILVAGLGALGVYLGADEDGVVQPAPTMPPETSGHTV